MSMIRIETTGRDELDKATRLLAGISGGTEKAVKSAMSRTVSSLRTSSAKAIRERYAISRANIRANENVSVRYTHENGVQAFVTFSGRKIPLYRYDGASPKVPTENKGALVQAIVNGKWMTVHPSLPASGHQLKSTSPQHFQNAFIAEMKSGHIGIFERTGGATATGSDAIKEIMGSSVPQMLGSKEVEEKLADEAMAKFDERLEHEVLAILNGWR